MLTHHTLQVDTISQPTLSINTPCKLHACMYLWTSQAMLCFLDKLTFKYASAISIAYSVMEDPEFQ